MLNSYFLRLSVILILIGCSSQNKAVKQSANPNTEKLNLSSPETAENKILFLTLAITLTDSIRDTYKVTQVNATFANGVLHKNSFREDTPIEPYHLYCEITDDSKKRVDLIKVRNPLLQVFEYSPDKEKLEKKLFSSRTGNIYLRFQFSKASKYLTIYKPHSDLRTLKKIYHAQMWS